VIFKSSSISSDSSSILALDSFVSNISDLIKSLNPSKSKSFHLKSLINSGVNSGLTAFSNFLIVILKIESIPANSEL